MPISIKLADATAEFMGDGVVMICQDSDQGPQDVVITEADLEALLATMKGR